MWDKVILENVGILRYIPDCYKNKKMYVKAVVTYSFAVQCIPECYKTQENV